MRFTLTVSPDGHALLTTPNDLSPDEVRHISEAWDRWKETPQGFAIVGSCDLKHVQSHEIDLEVAS